MQESAAAGAGPEQSERRRVKRSCFPRWADTEPHVSGVLNQEGLHGWWIAGAVGSWSRWHLPGGGSICWDCNKGFVWLCVC